MTLKSRHIVSGLLFAALLPASAQTLSDGQTVVSNVACSAVGDKMQLTMDIALDDLQLGHNKSVVVHPQIVSLDGTRQSSFEPLVVDSRAQYVLYERGIVNKAYAGAPHVKRNKGKAQTVTYLSKVPYESWMESYDIRIGEDLCACGDLSEMPYVAALHRATPPDPYDLIGLAFQEPAQDKGPYELHGSAYITFVVNKWEMKPDYMNNRRELRKITDTLDIMVADPNITVKEIKIHGWASPESPYAHNRMLAVNRAQSLTDWLRRNYSLPASAFAPAEATPENWLGLKDALTTMGGEVAHRSEILDIAGSLLAQGEKEMERNADAAEARIKSNYPQDYSYLLRNVYPSLRRSDYDITFNVRKFNSDAECLDIYRTKPYQLSKYELWRVAQSFEPYSDEYNRAVQTAFNYYPSDEAVNLNLANVAIRQHDLLKAESLLKNAGNGAAAENARATLCILRGQYAEAARHLDSAERQSDASAEVKAGIAKNREAIALLQQQ